MRLTAHTDYALRMLIYLAVKDDGLATIGEIADRYAISQNHLTKVAHHLGVAGFITTMRGKHGGLKLARPAEEISLGAVVRRAEPDMTLVPCFTAGDTSCRIGPACGLPPVLLEAREAFLAVLDRYSIADVVRQRAGLRALLQLHEPFVSAPPA
jgi:Rrf2 family nitric oxide-sensitive transcriptional repressor